MMGVEPAEPDTPLAEALLGTTLRGTYQVLEVLDQGGMGIVFVAEHKRLKRKLAVKLLSQHMANNPHAMARFNREAEIISQLTHPNIVQVVDFDTTEAGEPYLVMELLHGESLEARLERERRLPTLEAIRITTQVASGLTAAHKSSIVHRDLKPGNIFLVDIQGGHSFVKLLDFGISKRTGGSRSLTGEFDILGTPDYMAPEQASGKTALVDHRGDQFALAVIAYQMLTGALPFAGNNVMEILRRVLHDAPAPPSLLNDELSSAIDAVLARALSKNPEERYDSINAFAQDLAAVSGCSLPPGFSMTPGTSPSTNPEPPTQVRPVYNQDTQLKLERKTLSDTQSSVTGARRKMPSSHTAESVAEILDRARDALGDGSTERAVSLAEEALSLAEQSNDALAQRSIAGSETLLKKIFEQRLGSMESVVLINEHAMGSARLSPEQAFLLSRLEGGVSFEEALDLVPTTRQEALRQMVGLLRAGLITSG